MCSITPPLERGPMWHRHWQRAMGFQTNQLLKAFGRRLKVVEYRDASEASDWKLGTRNRIMRLVGQRAKP